MPKYTRTCAVCGNKFQTTHPKQPTCGRSCGGKYKPKKLSPALVHELNAYRMPLSSGYTTVIDADDLDLAEFSWFAVVRAPGFVYAGRTKRPDEPLPHTIQIHRVILSRMLNRTLQPGEIVDHINGDGLDNRRANIRLATYSQNAANSRVQRDSRSGVKGCYFNKKSKKWHAQISALGKRIHLGFFDNASDANGAYFEAAKKYHGEFANDGTYHKDRQDSDEGSNGK